jgi:predicted regulator of Ras-like GTPase activity (Roadblock/LC7/MglB family)
VSDVSWKTPTMAELYFKQGHVDQAVAIYRELVAERPDDTQLAQRLRELQAPTGGLMSFREHLQRIVSSVPGAMSAAVLGFDGIVVDGFEAPGNPYDMTVFLTEYTATAKHLSQSVSRVPDVGTLGDIAINAENVTCLMRPLTSDYLLSVMMKPGSLNGKARYIMRVVTPLLAQELV